MSSDLNDETRNLLLLDARALKRTGVLLKHITVIYCDNPELWRRIEQELEANRDLINRSIDIARQQYKKSA